MFIQDSVGLQYKSKYEGDLVAKCYFAKHKLVWEVLDGALKNKIEIQWSDIVAIKANYAVEGTDTVEVMVMPTFLVFISFIVIYGLRFIKFDIIDLVVYSWQGSPFSFGKQTHNLESTHYGSLHQILQVGRQA